MSLLEYGKKELIGLDPEDICWQLTKEEILHLFTVFRAYWSYDERAAEEGRAGCHAILSNGLHSSGFFNSEPVLEHDNLCEMLARQLVMKYRSLRGLPASRVIGVPRGATRLAAAVARELGLPVGILRKTGDGFNLETDISPGEVLLFIEDFVRGATNLSDAIWASRRKQPLAVISNYHPLILNRGNHSVVQVERSNFGLAYLTSHLMEDWRPANCRLCYQYHSEPISPKEPEENWGRLINSQAA
jgi:hypothetical protein